MEKLYKGPAFWVLLLFLSMFQNANAQFVAQKTDGSAIASDASKTGNDTSEGAAKEVKKVAEDYYNKVVGWKEDVAEKAASFQETAEATKKNIEDAQQDLNEAIEEGKSAYEDAQGTLNDVEGATESLGEADVDALSDQLGALTQQREDRRTAVGAELTSKKETADQNVATLQNMYDQAPDPQTKEQLKTALDEALAAQQAARDALKNFESDPEAFLKNDAQYAELANQITGLSGQLDGLKNEGIALAQGFLDQLLSMSDEDRAAQYQQVWQENFLAKDEVEKPETTMRILKHRHKEFAKETARNMALGIKRKVAAEEDFEKIEMTQKNTAAVDHSQSSVNLLIEQRVKDLDILYNFTELLIADLRYKTAQDLLGMPAKLRDYDRDPSVLNLDDYVFTEESFGTDENKVNPFDELLGK